MSAAQDRLELSRARLRSAMLPAPRLVDRLDNTSPPWLARLKALPGIGVVVDTIDGWWAHHPMRSVTELAAQTSGALVGPIARRRPIALVLGAAAVGAVLAWGRPARWIFRSALFAGLVPQLAKRIVASLPLDALLKHSVAPRPSSATDFDRRAAFP